MFKPTLYQGRLGQWNVSELADQGILWGSIKFSVDSDRRVSRAHVSPEALDQKVQVRTINRGLIIDCEGEIIADAAGLATGVGKAWAGQNLATCAHFAAAVTTEGGVETTPAQIRLGYTRDPAKLLQVYEPTLDLSVENPAAFKFKADYFPHIDHDAGAAA